MRRDLFWAFHPKRVMVPSLALKFALPLEMRVGVAGDAQPGFRRRVGPHVREDRGVGDGFDEPRAEDRRGDAENDVRIPALAGERISGRQEVRLGDVAAGGSVRPVMTKRSCTSPSLVPLGFLLKRASRTGPLAAMNQGTMFLAPLSVATAIRGFCAGLDPPVAGCEWQERHWLELKRGPSPLLAPPATTSTSPKRTDPSWKNAASSEVRLRRGHPRRARRSELRDRRGPGRGWVRFEPLRRRRL